VNAIRALGDASADKARNVPALTVVSHYDGNNLRWFVQERSQAVSADDNNDTRRQKGGRNA
jgi:hypothetical protein